MVRDKRIIVGDAFPVSFSIYLEFADGRKRTSDNMGEYDLHILLAWMGTTNPNNLVKFTVTKNA